MERAIVNKIIKTSAVDGPGNRMVIFFQGCNFNCSYCHNPETINLCSGCGACAEVCPAHALSMAKGKVKWDKTLCTGCDRCLSACSLLSTPKTKLISDDEVMVEVKSSLPFIRGITVSGGECTLHHAFVTELFKEAKALNLSTMIDSNGSYDFSKDRALLELTDGVMLDIKAFDSNAHKNLTGMGNEKVLKNALYLAESQKLYEIRTVVVPGLLPNEETVREVSRLLKPYAEKYDIIYKLISFRPNGVRKEYAGYSVPGNDHMQELKEIALSSGFTNVVVV